MESFMKVHDDKSIKILRNLSQSPCVWMDMLFPQSHSLINENPKVRALKTILDPCPESDGKILLLQTPFGCRIYRNDTGSDL